jgi:hypothetical protein
MRIDLRNSVLENEHWRKEVHKAAVITQKKRRVMIEVKE